MPNKKLKSKATIPKKLRKIITFEELKLQEQKYIARLLELKYCIQYIQEALDGEALINREQYIKDKWNLYVNCDPLPKPYAPPQIYALFAKLNFIEKNHIERMVDWTLRIDERSILSQDILRKDLTRKTLEDTIKPELGYLYGQIIGNSVEILNRIDKFLRNDSELAKVKDATLQEIADIRLYIQEQIKQFINHYTYRIICADEAYMISLDALSEDYYFSCDYFDIHLWSLKRVPIRFAHMSSLHFLLNLHNINLTVHIPHSMLRDDLTIKALRLNYDHLSEYAKTFDQIIPEGYENISAGIQDLAECLTTEWLMQTTLQKTIRTEMVEAYEEYEIKLKEYQDFVERAKKEKDVKSKKNKLRSPPVAPPFLEPNEYPDVHDDFLAAEENQYKSFMENVYSPKNFNLHYHQINLRKYLILGGIYQLFYVRKPPHLSLDKINMTWHLNDFNIDENVVITNQPISPSIRPSDDENIDITNQHVSPSIHASGERPSDKIIKRITTTASERRLTITTNPTATIEADCPWFVVIFELPEYLCLWGMPIPCHFEYFEDEIKICETQLGNFGSQFNLTKTLSKKFRKVSSELEKVEKYKNKSLTDRQMEASNMKLNDLNDALLLIRKTHFRSHASVNYYSPSFFCSRVHTAKRMTHTFTHKAITDFYLNDMNLDETHILQRYCVDLISTSYKFAKEIDEELTKSEKEQSRGKHRLLRYQKTDDNKDKNNLFYDLFSYDENQNKPEYVYPHYAESGSININRQLEDSPSALPFKPKTFYQLVSTLLFIKKVVQDNLNHMLEMEPFTSRVPLAGRSIKIKENTRRSKKEEIKSKASRTSFPRKIFGSTSSHHGPHIRAHLIEPLSDKESIKDIPINIEKVSYYHWTTRHIKQINFDRENRKLTIETDRLGFIGLAFHRYEHFPFKYWDLRPSENDPSNEVIFTLETQHVKCVLKITEYGISGFVTDPIKSFVRKPKMYLVIDEPLTDYAEFKKRFREKNINIFAEHDARYYITNGYFSEKHLASEMHTYCCMAVHCTHIHFSLSQWNRLAKRREILLKFIQLNDNVNTAVTALVTPEEAKFVEVKELCSDQIDVINLHYTPTWRNIDSYCDLHHSICSMYATATDLRCKNPKVLCYVRNLLNEIRPLSFS